MKKNGFTLIEILVAMAIVAIIGVIFVTIFANTLRGSNKSQVLAVIKQNGQAILENISKSIRGADSIVCKSNSGDVLTIIKNGSYTRFRFVPPAVGSNGIIQRDNPVQPSTAPEDNIQLFLSTICTDPMGTDSSQVDTLTDTNTQSGVSVTTGLFERSRQSGFKDSITVSFTLGPGVNVPAAIAGQIDPIPFQTTIGLR